jgi:hypothetical protein
MKIESYKLTMFSGMSVLHTKFHYRSCLVWLFFVLKMKNKSLRFYIEYIIFSTCAALSLAQPDERMKLLNNIIRTFSVNYISLNSRSGLEI